MQPFVGIALKTDFMTGGGNLSGERWKFSGNPSQDKERRSNRMVGEKFQYTKYITFDPGCIRIPGMEWNAVRECFDVKVIFHVHRKGVQDSSGLGHQDPCRTSIVFAVLNRITRSSRPDMFLM